MLDNIKDKSIIIVPSSLKNNILRELSLKDSLLNVKVMSREEFIERSTFSYEDDAILFLMDKYKYDCNVCKILIDKINDLVLINLMILILFVIQITYLTYH